MLFFKAGRIFCQILFLKVLHKFPHCYNISILLNARIKSWWLPFLEDGKLFEFIL